MTCCALTLALGCVGLLGLRVDASAVVGPRAPALAGLWWPDSPRLGAFSLVDQDGQALTEQALRGTWTLLFFGYTHCPDVCPATLALIDRACDLLEADGHAHGIQVLFVSVDARRDTPALLARYVRHFNPAFRAATAPMEDLHLLSRALAADFTKIGGERADDYAYEHSASIYLVAPDLRVVGEFAPSLAAPALAARVHTIRRFIEVRG
ncbi:MAG: SCO family protein [Gammaproteobacteria bacterium]|nr:SCO family protein [Gammaproteobacteria bacterium]